MILNVAIFIIRLLRLTWQESKEYYWAYLNSDMDLVQAMLAMKYLESVLLLLLVAISSCPSQTNWVYGLERMMSMIWLRRPELMYPERWALLEWKALVQRSVACDVVGSFEQ